MKKLLMTFICVFLLSSVFAAPNEQNLKSSTSTSTVKTIVGTAKQDENHAKQSESVKSVKPVKKVYKEKIYNIECEDISGNIVQMDEFKGKVLLIVNTASKCGFTYQYEGLQKLYDEYKDQGLEVLGFPCNQFGKQEPAKEDKILSFCKLNYGVNFRLFKKINVNGRHTHPLFKYLKKSLPGFLTNNIKWNFTKFLIKADGKPFKRYGSTTKPKSLKSVIERLLKEVKQSKN